MSAYDNPRFYELDRQDPDSVEHAVSQFVYWSQGLHNMINEVPFTTDHQFYVHV